MPKGSIYFAMAFSVGVELLNMRMRARAARRRARVPAGPIRLRRPLSGEPPSGPARAASGPVE